LGITAVPTIRLENLSESQLRAYVIADNKIAECAGWDEEILAIEFETLLALDLEFDVTVTGFETAEIDLLVEHCDEDEDDLSELFPESHQYTPISKIGDLWLLGSHRLYCGDATKAQSYISLLGETKAQLIFSDPPYNVPIQGHVSGLGKAQHQEFQMASGEMTREEFTNFLRSVFDHLTNFSTPGSIHFHCMDWRHQQEILTAGHQYSELKNLCVWVKNNAGMGSFYRSKHELIFVFKNGSAPHINNVELGKHGRYRTNVWEYAGANSFHDDRMDELEMHPTVKPVAMVKDAILDCSQHGDAILDPFGGSGTTLIAAEQAGRIAYLMELDPLYMDVILKRYLKQTGVEPILEKTGQTFTDLISDKEQSINNNLSKAQSSSQENLPEELNIKEVSDD